MRLKRLPFLLLPPQVHLSVVPNLLGVWAKLLQHAGDRIAADMRAQGVLTARSFQGSTQPMMVVMACLERFAAQPQLAHIAGGVLAVTLRVIEVRPAGYGWTSFRTVLAGPSNARPPPVATAQL